MGIAEGAVEPGAAAEFPELRVVWLDLAARARPSPEPLREQLRRLSDGFRGAQAIVLRRQPIPLAYRTFFRHIGLDPDVDRIQVEALVLERLTAGGFASRNTLDDALTLATMETGLPLWALDGDRVHGPLGIREARTGERLGLPAGRLVVADDGGPLAALFGELAPGRGVTRRTRRMRLFSVLVAGVPEIHVEEAFWMLEEMLGE